MVDLVWITRVGTTIPCLEAGNLLFKAEGALHMEPSYDQLISEFVDSKVASNECLFKQAAIAFFLKERMCVTAKQIGGDVGYSGRYVNVLAKTFSCFPEPESRAADLSFSHHQIAAHTDNPSYWIDQAVANGWSVRELSREIRGIEDTDEVAEAERLWGKVELMLLAKEHGARLLIYNFKRWLADNDVSETPAQEEKETATL